MAQISLRATSAAAGSSDGMVQTPDMSKLSPPEMARYIGGFTAELTIMARQAKLDLLAYLLEMAQNEVARLTRDMPPRP